MTPADHDDTADKGSDNTTKKSSDDTPKKSSDNILKKSSDGTPDKSSDDKEDEKRSTTPSAAGNVHRFDPQLASSHIEHCQLVKQPHTCSLTAVICLRSSPRDKSCKKHGSTISSWRMKSWMPLR